MPIEIDMESEKRKQNLRHLPKLSFNPVLPVHLLLVPRNKVGHGKGMVGLFLRVVGVSLVGKGESHKNDQKAGVPLL